MERSSVPGSCLVLLIVLCVSEQKVNCNVRKHPGGYVNAHLSVYAKWVVRS
jgi:hypothetical protein